MNYCDQCTDHEECRSAGCSNPRRHPQQLNNKGSIVLPYQKTTEQEGDVMSIDDDWERHATKPIQEELRDTRQRVMGGDYDVINNAIEHINRLEADLEQLIKKGD